MAHPSVLRRLRAQKEAEALRALREMHPEESELLDRAQHDASSGPEFVDAAMTIELVRVVSKQQRQIENLLGRIRKLEKPEAKAEAKKH